MLLATVEGAVDGLIRSGSTKVRAGNLRATERSEKVDGTLGGPKYFPVRLSDRWQRGAIENASESGRLGLAKDGLAAERPSYETEKLATNSPKSAIHFSAVGSSEAGELSLKLISKDLSVRASTGSPSALSFLAMTSSACWISKP